MKVLVVNVGSTSLKFRVFEMPAEDVLAEGRIERVGSAMSPVSYRGRSGRPVQREAHFPSQRAAIEHAISLVLDPDEGVLGSLDELAAIGFKPVQAKGIADSVFVTEEVVDAMEEFSFVAPAHNPQYIEAFRTFGALLPSIPLVGVFEPAFHRTIPPYARTYGVPARWVERYGIRRYGFHGSSHRYISLRVPELLGRPPEGLRIVSCHLGGSSSICAIRDGASVDTSMGFSPQSGLPHATRTGDLDPFVVLYLIACEGLGAEEIARELSTNGGLAGISGTSGDIRDLEAAAAAGSDAAERALAVFVHETRKYIGAYVAVLEGLDVLAFTGGIGENGAAIRARICRGLDCLGISLDASRNMQLRGEGRISVDDSPVTILVIRANEELIIARETARLVSERYSNAGTSQPATSDATARPAMRTGDKAPMV